MAPLTASRQNSMSPAAKPKPFRLKSLDKLSPSPLQRALSMSARAPATPLDKEPGPSTYNTDTPLAITRAPSVSFSQADRSKHPYISPRHCDITQSSPGPKYARDSILASSRMRRAPSATFAGRPRTPLTERLAREAKKAGRKGSRTARARAKTAEALAPVGPSTYDPHHDLLLKKSPRCAFSRSGRLFATSPRQERGMPQPPGPTAYSDKCTRKQFPQISFGSHDRKPRPQRPGECAPCDRTSFITHDIRGGIATPATFKYGVAPTDYSPRYDKQCRKAPRSTFGNAKRFANTYISRHHVTGDTSSVPGPKYQLKQTRAGHGAPKPHLFWSP